MMNLFQHYLTDIKKDTNITKLQQYTNIINTHMRFRIRSINPNNPFTPYGGTTIRGGQKIFVLISVIRGLKKQPLNSRTMARCYYCFIDPG